MGMNLASNEKAYYYGQQELMSAMSVGESK